MQAPRVIINDNDDSLFIGTNLPLGISGAKGITERGPVDDPSTVLSNPEDYRRLFGGSVAGSNFPELVQRYLSKGGKLRISRTGAYTDITDKSTLLVLKPGAKVIATAASGGTDLFTATPKYPGVKYNDSKVEILAATNGQAGFFNLKEYISTDLTYSTKLHENLTIVGRPTIEGSTYLDEVNLLSELFVYTYKDLSGVAAGATLRPLNGVTAFTGGSNGAAPQPVDYIGDGVAGTGLHSFDAYDDFFQIGIPDIYDATVNQGGLAYADGRKDLFFFAHINQALNTVSAINAARDAVTYDTKYGAFFSGGITIKDAKTQQVKDVSEVMDMLFLSARVMELYGPGFSFANYTRGQITDALGVTTNFGSSGSYDKLNAVAQHGVNMTINRDGRTFLNSAFTAQLAQSKASFINVVMVLIFIRKTLRPVLNRFLEEPTDLDTFRAIYREIEPIMKALKNGRAVYNWKWEGDQDVAVITDVKINRLADIDQGKYKAKLRIEPIVGMQEIEIEIGLNRTGELTIELVENP